MESSEVTENNFLKVCCPKCHLNDLQNPTGKIKQILQCFPHFSILGAFINPPASTLCMSVGPEWEYSDAI